MTRQSSVLPEKETVFPTRRKLWTFRKPQCGLMIFQGLVHDGVALCQRPLRPRSFGQHANVARLDPTVADDAKIKSGSAISFRLFL